MYRNRPYGVKKVVSRLALSVRRICQYPFVASSVAKYRLDLGMGLDSGAGGHEGVDGSDDELVEGLVVDDRSDAALGFEDDQERGAPR
ncbi:MAG: hypothetical protein O4860_13245, partial [Trichodesmium sp. St2_bin2_1]|nr:hypothetical protein [Trichodesmium sp. St2_bin2_1]